MSINISQNLFDKNSFDVFFDTEKVGAIEYSNENYKAIPIDGTAIVFSKITLCENYFKNIHKSKKSNIQTQAEDKSQLNLF